MTDAHPGQVIVARAHREVRTRQGTLNGTRPQALAHCPSSRAFKPRRPQHTRRTRTEAKFTSGKQIHTLTTMRKYDKYYIVNKAGVGSASVSPTRPRRNGTEWRMGLRLHCIPPRARALGPSSQKMPAFSSPCVAQLPAAAAAACCLASSIAAGSPPWYQAGLISSGRK